MPSINFKSSKPFFFASLFFAVLLLITVVIKLVFAWNPPTTIAPNPAGQTLYSDSSNNIGIGTLYPGAKLEVYSTSSDSVLKLSRQSATSTLFKLGTDAAFIINNNASDILTIKNGKVGISTSTPVAKLDIYGGDTSFAWGGDHSASGYIRIGNMQICWGNGSATNPTSPFYIAYSEFTFPSGCTFNNTTYSLIANLTSTSGNGKAFTQFQVSNLSTTGAKVYFHKISDAAQEDLSATGDVPFTWMAIGTWQ